MTTMFARSSSSSDRVGRRLPHGVAVRVRRVPAWTRPRDRVGRLGSGRCAVTGGWVSWGQDIPVLVGAYVFADFCRGRLEALRLIDGRAQEHEELGPQVANAASFGEDADGELYVLSLSGPVFRLVPA